MVVDRYLAAAEIQQTRLNGALMEVDIEASVPKLKRRGRLHALRRISQLGRITYELLRFEGDKSVKSEVIARYLTAESEPRDSAKTSLAVTPANYKFRYKGLTDAAGRVAHVFQVTPRKKRVGLFNGELWIDSETALPLREAGRFVKTPSIFLKRVEFVREYEIRDGVAVPLRLETTVDTRLVGKAMLSVAFHSVSLPEAPLAPVVAGDSQ